MTRRPVSSSELPFRTEGPVPASPPFVAGMGHSDRASQRVIIGFCPFLLSRNEQESRSEEEEEEEAMEPSRPTAMTLHIQCHRPVRASPRTVGLVAGGLIA